MVALLGIVSWLVALLAAAGVALGLSLLLFPKLQQWPADFVQRHLFPDANQVNLRDSKGSSGQQRSVFRILCFGDSLTEGFTSGGVNFHPYAKRLGDKVYSIMPQGWHLEVEEQGEAGERVLISMKHRLQRTLDEHTDAGRPYDWVLLLGGINDLAGDMSSAEEVLFGLQVLTEACLAHGAHVMLMTVMEVAEPEPKVEQQRLKLNQLLQQYVQDKHWAAAAAATQGGVTAATAAAGGSSGSNAQKQQQQKAAGTRANNSSSSSMSPVSRRGTPRVVLFDLASKLTWSGMDEESRWQVWDDGVHLTIDGYDLMGDLVFEALAPLVSQELGAKTGAAAAGGEGGAAAAAGGAAQGKADVAAAVQAVANGHKKDA